VLPSDASYTITLLGLAEAKSSDRTAPGGQAHQRTNWWRKVTIAAATTPIGVVAMSTALLAVAAILVIATTATLVLTFLSVTTKIRVWILSLAIALEMFNGIY
jgi:hypothetical protein